MKPILAVLLSVFTLHSASAQKYELWVNGNSGLFHFNGESAMKTTGLYYTADGYSYAFPYGSKNGLGYGLSLQLQRVTKYKLIYGIDAGYEHFDSKAEIVRGSFSNSISSSAITPVAASGTAKSGYGFINVRPLIGYRFIVGKVALDATGSFDFAYCTDAKQRINATANNQKVKDKEEIDKPEKEIRPRLQLNACYQKYGIYAGYSFGQRNYMEGYVGGKPEAYASIFRFGLSYRIL